MYGVDNNQQRRPSLRYDRTRAQAFIPSFIFGNVQSFINSFYTVSAPPYDPVTSLMPQTPTHFTVRDLVNGAMIVSSPIPIANYSQAFNIIGDTTGQYIGSTVLIEFLNVISNTVKNTLFGVPVDVATGTYIAPA